MSFVRQRKGLPRLGARLRAGQEARIASFGGTVTYQGYYLAGLVRVLAKAYPAAVINTLTRALPGFSSEQGVFRTRSVLDMNPDVTFVEFAMHDTESRPDRISRAVEGMVRQLRANDPDRELAFVYFGYAGAIADGKMKPVVDAWERVADHYGIPSFDGVVLAQELIASGLAVWFAPWPGKQEWEPSNHPFPLTRDGGDQTASGGSVIGAHMAQTMLSMLDTVTLRTAGELPAPLEAGEWSEATQLDASALLAPGWRADKIVDEMARRPPAMFFEQLASADHEGARIRIPFVGRYATIWTVGAGGTLAVALDGRWSVTADAPDSMQHAFNVLDEDFSAPHVFEAEARSLPVLVGGLDVVGQVLPRTPSNG